MNGKCVLVVEDEYLVAEHICDLLRGIGAVPTAVPSVAAALGALARQPFDLATLDIDLRGETSAAVADALARHRTPFLFVTGQDERHVPAGHERRPFLSKAALHRLPETCRDTCEGLGEGLGAGLNARSHVTH